jgi:hypothetical protein
VLAGAGQPDSTALALTEGFQAAFLVAFGIALLGALLALLLLRREDTTEDAAIEAARDIAPCPPTRTSALPALER